MTATTHWCPACRTRKPIDEFYGGKGRCKPCLSAAYKQRHVERSGPAPICATCGHQMPRKRNSPSECSRCRDARRRRERAESMGSCEGCGTPLTGRQTRWCKACAEVAARQGASHRKTLQDRPYVTHKKNACEACGFSGMPCQLDVHHVDGDRQNDSPENLQTLCANCHRLVTFGHAA